jgi:hypothetical protein
MRRAGGEIHTEKDGLRLLGLSRIPRCSVCRRFEALKTAYDSGLHLAEPLAPVPPNCPHEHCRPLISRLCPDHGESPIEGLG